MTTPLSLAVGRFKQLPQRAGATWQGGLVRIPAWVENPEDPSRPFRPKGAIWVNLHSGRLHLDLAAKDTTATPALALDVLLEFARKETRLGDGRPGRIEVVDAELRDALDAALAGTGTTVVAVDSLPAVAEALRSLEASQPAVRRFQECSTRLASGSSGCGPSRRPPSGSIWRVRGNTS